MILLDSNNKPVLLGGQLMRAGAYTPPEVPVDPPAPGAELPLASIAGWWDAGSMAPGAVSTITDRSTAGKNASTAAHVVPRRAGLLAGIYAEGSASNYTVRQPVIEDFTVGANNITVGASDKLAVMLVWSRAQLKQPGKGAFSNAPVDLLKIGANVVLQLAAAGTGADALTLFPAGAAVSAGTLPLRHTRGVLLQFNGAAVSGWLDDGTQLFIDVASGITLGGAANLSFLPAAQMVFHEAAAWSKVLDSIERAAALSYMGRWPMGERFAAHTLGIGQSNASNLINALFPYIGKALTYMTGCLSSNMLCGGINISGSTLFSGTGLYDGTANLFLNSSGGGDPATWPLGTNGNTFMAALDTLSADDRDSLNSISWFWSESMSTYLTASMKADFLAAMKRAFSLIRAKLGRTAAQLPILVIDALPFPTTVGAQTHREVIADLIADASQNVKMVLANSQDAIGQGDTWDAATGLESGPGNNAHRDTDGMSGYSRRMIAPLARASLAALAARGKPDVWTAVDASIPVTGGPRVVSATYEGTVYAPTGTMLVTFAHDGGNDIVVPLRAALGVGWYLMDGVSDTVAGTPGAPGTLIAATAFVRVSATQGRVTLASVPLHPAKGLAYYTYGTGLDVNNYAVIGRGNAVTDNYSTVTPAAGWRIKDYLGVAAQPNNPVQTTAYGVLLT